MQSFNLKSDMPTVEVAIQRLQNWIKYLPKTEKIVKVIHGYGSTGTGGRIRKAVRQELETMKTKKQIKEYIPGEALGIPMGYVDIIQKYKALLVNDPDYHRTNDGITFIIL